MICAKIQRVLFWRTLQIAHLIWGTIKVTISLLELLPLSSFKITFIGRLGFRSLFRKRRCSARFDLIVMRAGSHKKTNCDHGACDRRGRHPNSGAPSHQFAYQGPHAPNNCSDGGGVCETSIG